jgi:hypothetical protein
MGDVRKYGEWKKKYVSRRSKIILKTAVGNSAFAITS